MIVMRDEQGFEATQSVGLPPSYGAHDPPKQLPPPPIVPQGNGRWKFSTMTKEEEVLSGQEYSYRLLALCAQGKHETKRHYGAGGIICAVMLFPIGLFCLALDSRRNCSRCGVRLD